MGREKVNLDKSRAVMTEWSVAEEMAGSVGGGGTTCSDLMMTNASMTNEHASQRPPVYHCSNDSDSAIDIEVSQHGQVVRHPSG